MEEQENTHTQRIIYVFVLNSAQSSAAVAVVVTVLNYKIVESAVISISIIVMNADPYMSYFISVYPSFSSGFFFK